MFLLVVTLPLPASRFKQLGRKNLGPGNEGIRNELEVSQDFITFRERSKKRAINILRRKPSNRFFLRSAALGKSCIFMTGLGYQKNSDQEVF